MLFCSNRKRRVCLFVWRESGLTVDFQSTFYLWFVFVKQHNPMMRILNSLFFFFPIFYGDTFYKSTFLWSMTFFESLKFVGSTLSWTLRAGCIAHLIHENVYEFTETRGESMLPTLQNQHDYVHALKKYKYGRNLVMGDCIVAIKPSDPSHRICKRITGMPGDMILVDPSSSSELTNSPNEIIQHDGYNKYIRIPEGHVWCTGDNLCHSLDSRSYGVVPMGLITGKIVAANSMSEGISTLYNFRWITNTLQDEWYIYIYMMIQGFVCFCFVPFQRNIDVSI